MSKSYLALLLAACLLPIEAQVNKTNLTGIVRDRSGAAVRDAEWTFERAKDIWKPMSRAVAHVGVPGYQWQAGILWDGSLFFGPERRRLAGVAMEETAPLGNNLLHISIGYGHPAKFLDRRAIGNPAIRRSLDEGRLPIPHVQVKDGDLEWDESVFAHLLDRRLEDGLQPRPEDLLIVRALFRVRNGSGRSATGHLWLHFGDTSQVALGYKAGQGEELGNALAHRFEAPLGLLEERVRYVIPKPPKGKLVWHAEAPPPEGMKKAARNIIEWQVPLAAGEEAEIQVIVPYAAVDRAVGDKLAVADHKAQLADVRWFWRGLVSGAKGAITTADVFINDYVAAVAGQMTQEIAYRHKALVWMYKTSPNHYESYWACAGAKSLPTLDLRGLTAYSRPVLKSFIDTQSADVGKLTEIDGKSVGGEGFARRPGFLGNFGDWSRYVWLINHGAAMWALASHFRITRDPQWLGSGPGSPVQALLDAFDWAAEQRRRTMREENGRKVPHWGLLPAARTHDWMAGNAIFNDAFCIYGMAETVRLLREIDHPRTNELASELNDYRSCLRQRYIEARDRARRLPLPDGSELPYVPRDVYELDWVKPDWTYTAAGPLRAGGYGALDPHDELVGQALAFLEAGMPKGQGSYLKLQTQASGQPTADENFRGINDSNAERHYLWRHYVEYETMWPVGFDLFLQRDDLPRFFEWLFNNLAVAVHHGFRVGVESLDGPPATAPGEAERWRAIRNMFVNERGGYDGSQQSLWLMQAIPCSWLKPGSQLGVKEMGTHFGGQVSLDARVARDGKSITVAASLNLALAPSETRMRLRSGDGGPLASVEVNGVRTEILDKDIIRLPAETKGEYRIIARFQ